MTDLTGAKWRKSTRSGNGGNCVEVATNLHPTTGIVAVRDSKDTSGPSLIFTAADWRTFIKNAQSL
ncbi:DUF397 domain-containing protein [Micromonospora sp. WMMA1363]|uniref:DUF397 domain-containing protein n=1 Tax=Micromonospora sp. WMMA1363 TaxID=3053985 RepID=UPI00259CF8D7|nr:DUF397 domain-containing protein [Micromonospora sp. WMMA1363]MDM4723173.1 DUF397 domain-containing protein [Micromonospora sp. WMMA1363]